MPTEYKENLTLQQIKVIQGDRSCMVSMESPCVTSY